VKHKTIILDRDGVINEDSVGYIKSLAEWVPIPGSLQAIADLSKSGFSVFVITNQSGIGRGYYSLQAMQQIHDHMLQEVDKLGGAIQGIYFCPHHPDLQCECRKPNTGMFLQLAKEHSVDLQQSFYVGDKLTDLQAGDGVNAQSILVKTGNGEDTLRHLASDHFYLVYSCLSAFAKDVIDGKL